MATLDPTVPANEGAEQVLLGNMMYMSETIARVSGVLRPEDFYFGAHRTIYDAILTLSETGKAVDSVTVADLLQREGELERIGGAAFLGELVHMARPSTTAEYADIVSRNAARRRLISHHEAGRQRALNGSSMDLEELLDTAQNEFDQIAEQRTSNDVVRVGDAYTETIQYIEDLGKGDVYTGGVPTGFVDLDHQIKGLFPGQMIVVAARPGIGKSTLGMDFIRSCSIKHGQPSLIFSLEMSKVEMTTRLISAECRINLTSLREGKLEESDWGRLAAKMGAITEAPIYMDDTASLTMTEIRAKARRVKSRHGLRLIVIDYLQLMNADGRAESRQQAVSDMSRNCKLLAKELEVPVVVMSQLNRGPENRADKKPAISDLRESGSIEQDADVVILMYREDAAVGEESARVGECDLIVAKQRNGPTGTITVMSQLSNSRFVDAYQG